MVQGKYVENSNKNLQTVMSMGKVFHTRSLYHAGMT